MDVDTLLNGVIRLSNFMTSRLVVAGVVFYVLSGFLTVGSVSEGFLPNVDLVNNVVENYQRIFDILGVSDFALLLILFVFLTTIHIVYVAFEAIGKYLPPAIVPVSGWLALDDLTLKAFEVLRDARGEEHTDEENQRLYEFKRKLREMDQESKEKYRERLEGTYSTFRIAKTFVLFSVGALIYAWFAGYGGSMNLLLVIFAFSVLLSLVSGFSIYRTHHVRVTRLYRDVVGEIIEFSRVWVTPEYQEKLIGICASERQLSHVSLEVVVPVYGTLDAFLADVRKLKRRTTKSLVSGAEQ